jgi:myo-inositol-1(or 4)-monophosphatase
MMGWPMTEGFSGSVIGHSRHDQPRRRRVSENYREYQVAAERIAAEAGGLLLEAYGRVSAREKGPADLVTEADFASQRLIAQRLNEAFPHHTLLAEEDDAGPATDYAKAWRWVVDPLDGTMNYAHGFPFWVVSIALEHARTLVVGVVYNPLTRETYSASLGRGATRDGCPIQVSVVDRLDASLIVTALPIDFAADADRQTAYMRRFSTRTHSLRRTGSSALNLALLAAGGCDVCYATAMNPWDAAAGVVLVREAGGTITRFNGETYDLYTREILATNGRVHGESIRALAEAWDG